MMNICLVSREHSSDGQAGGIGTYTGNAARALARLGQTVHVITETRGRPSTRVEDGVSVQRLAAPQEHPVPLLARARAVARAVEELPWIPDIVQVCEYHAEGVWYAVRKQPRTRLVTRLATPSFLVQELNRHSGVSRWRTRAYVDVLERCQTRWSDAIITPSDALANIVCPRWRIPRQSVTTIPSGVDFALRIGARAAELPEKLQGRSYLLYFGRLEERKGVHVLAQALPQLLATFPELHVVFAGNNSGLYKGETMQTFVERSNQAYRDRLHFFPHLAHEDLYPLLKHAVLVVLPSLWESLANASLEAIDLGKPVVATLGGGFSEVIEDGRSGVLVPPGDVTALQQALLSLLADPGRLERMSAVARARARCFNLEKVTRQLLRFYEGLQSEIADEAARPPPFFRRS